MKKLVPLLLFFLFVSIMANVFTCNNYIDSPQVDQAKVDKSEQKVKRLEAEIKLLQDSIESSNERTGIIITHREFDRAQSSIKIAATKELSEPAADSAWDERYDSKKESLVEAAECDSLFLEYRSLTDLYNESLTKSALLTKSNVKKDTTIEELKFQNESHQLAATNAKDQLKKEKAKKWMWIGLGIVGGIIGYKATK